MRGRKALPSRIIELRGGTRYTHRAPRDQEPKPPVRMPSCPKHLDPIAKAEWRRAGRILRKIGLLTGLDRAVFAGFCQSYSEWVTATIEVQKGMVYRRKDGTPGLNPYLRLAREAYERMLKAGAVLGMSPGARAGLKVEKPKELGKLELFMRRKRGNGAR